MGWAAKWFRGLLGLKKPDSSSPATTFPKQSKEKRGWSFVKSQREKYHHTVDVAVRSSGHLTGVDPDKHAIAVAAATAAVAEAAVSAAQAAAAVVRFTSSRPCTDNAVETAAHVSAGSRIREEWAAIKIQAAFRGCLARRALRALKGLVKLQALVRGHIERKRTAEWLQRMQVLLRAQARARVGRAHILQTSYSSAKPLNIQTGPATPDKFESPIRFKNLKHDQSLMLKRNGSTSYVQIHGNQERLSKSDSRVYEQSWNRQRSRTCSADDEKSVGVLDIDSGKPYFREKRRTLFHYAHSDQHSQSLEATTHQSGQSSSSGEVQSYSPVKIDEIESPFRTSANSRPQLYSASSRGGGSKTSPFTSSRSVGSRSYTSAYSDHSNYMAFTESSKAKVRSLSSPKQRPEYERSSSSNRHSRHGSGESRLAAQWASSLHTSFTSKHYPGSGRLDKLGIPVGYRN